MLSVRINDIPYSADPIDFDDAVHHVTFRPVFSGLVNNYRLGGYTPILAQSWQEYGK